MSNNCPLNVILVNEDDGADLSGEIERGNYVFLDTGISDVACPLKITMELNDGETIIEYVVELDADRKVVREYTTKTHTDELIAKLLDEYAG